MDKNLAFAIGTSAIVLLILASLYMLYRKNEDLIKEIDYMKQSMYSGSKTKKYILKESDSQNSESSSESEHDSDSDSDDYEEQEIDFEPLLRESLDTFMRDGHSTDDLMGRIQELSTPFDSDSEHGEESGADADIDSPPSPVEEKIKLPKKSKKSKK
jgi:hypothetical protein